MRIGAKRIQLIILYTCVLVGFVLISILGSKAVSVLSEESVFKHRNTVVIDAGHGKPDGGTTSCTGVTEDVINLDIALRLDDLMHLLGIDTLMVRKDEQSIYSEGESIAKKKISDLKNRVNLVNNTENAILISIHQNYFPDSKYSGAQVFCINQESKKLANMLQGEFIRTLNENSRRQVKNGKGIYLLEHTSCIGVLVECGFLSNPNEENLLRSDAYQKNICCVIASSLSTYLNS